MVTEDNFDLGDFEENFSTSSFNPQKFDDPSTFKIRNDPQELLERFKLQLLNAYKVQVRERDEVTGKLVTKTKLKQIKGTKPNANKQGVSDIFAYWEKFVNGHLVQANFLDHNDLKATMLTLSNDVTVDFIAMRKTWGISYSYAALLIRNTIHLFYIFLTRGVGNEERKGYGEAYKETTERKLQNEHKPNPFTKVASYIMGGQK